MKDAASGGPSCSITVRVKSGVAIGTAWTPGVAGEDSGGENECICSIIWGGRMPNVGVAGG